MRYRIFLSCLLLLLLSGCGELSEEEKLALQDEKEKLQQEILSEKRTIVDYPYLNVNIALRKEYYPDVYDMFGSRYSDEKKYVRWTAHIIDKQEGEDTYPSFDQLVLQEEGLPKIYALFLVDIDTSFYKIGDIVTVSCHPSKLKDSQIELDSCRIEPTTEKELQEATNWTAIFAQALEVEKKKQLEEAIQSEIFRQKDEQERIIHHEAPENFKKIKLGMTYQQVSEILGFEGEEIRSEQSGNDIIQTFQWEINRNWNVLIDITFTNYKVTAKRQYPIPYE